MSVTEINSGVNSHANYTEWILIHKPLSTKYTVFLVSENFFFGIKKIAYIYVHALWLKKNIFYPNISIRIGSLLIKS